MGKLTALPIDRYRKLYNLGHFVETGTFYGDGTQFALDSGFESCHTIEVNEHYVNLARDRFKGKKVSVWQGTSIEQLPVILPYLHDPTLWWLDAHLQDVYGMPVDAFHPLPLEQELRIIAEGRDISKDVFLIDDLRIYEDFPNKPWDPEDRKRYASWNTQEGGAFIDEILSKTHRVSRLFIDDGYVVALPL